MKYYKKDGKEYARCTSVISSSDNKKGLIYWATGEYLKGLLKDFVRLAWYIRVNDYKSAINIIKNSRGNHAKIAKEATDVGSAVHKFAELYATQECAWQPDYNMTKQQEGEVFNGCKAFMDWYDKVSPQPIHTEYTVYGHGWAGTVDLICEIDGEIWVIDYKTSKRYYNTMAYQVAAYKNAYIGSGPTRCGVLMLDKYTGKYRLKETTKTYEKDLKIFNHMRDLYFLRQPRVAVRCGMGE